MKYLTHQPAAPLDSLVDRFWWLADTPAYALERVVPAGTFELVVNLAEDEIRVYGPDGAARCHAGAVVSGAFKASFVVDTRAHASMVGVHFKPGAARAFFGARADEMTDAHIGLAALWSPAAADRLRDALCSAATAAGRFAVLEHTLRQRLMPALAGGHLVKLLVSRPADSIAEIAQRTGRSHRAFIDMFSAEVGLTPKRFLRIRRFQRAFAQAAAPGRPAWAQLALDCGYCDQSHLIRDFIELAGVSPAEYLRRSPAAVKQDHIAQS